MEDESITRIFFFYLVVSVFVNIIVTSILFWIYSSLQQMMKRRWKFNSMPKRIILIRHGESVANVDKNIYSKIPDHKITLTDKGTEQAQERGIILKNVIRDEKSFWFVSPYTRTLQTFREISKSFGGVDELEWVEDPRIREFKWGQTIELERNKKLIGEKKMFGDFYHQYKTGESPADAFDRVASFIEYIHRKLRNNEKKAIENFILVTHCYTIKAFLGRWFNWNVKVLMDQKDLGSAGMIVLKRTYSENNEIVYKMDHRFSIDGKTDEITEVILKDCIQVT